MSSWKTYRHELEKLLIDAEDCALIARVATDVKKRDLFNRLATDLRGMAFDVQAMIALKRAGPKGDIKELRGRVRENMKVNFSNASDESLIAYTKVFGGKSGPILNLAGVITSRRENKAIRGQPSRGNGPRRMRF